MKKLLFLSCLMLVVSCSAQAMQPEIVGGIRDGLALGVMADAQVARNAGIRFGIEGNSGDQPIIIFFGGKFYLANLGQVPMSFGVGGVAYTGDDNTDIGVSLSLIINRAFNINPLFVEFGVDIVDSGRLQAQLGYKIY